MKIFADKNILSVENGFKQYGELQLFDGRAVQAEDLVDADVLLVRSITAVNESLLAGSAIKFVGTATSGTDHIDLDYLAANNICFADAKGSNANAVVDYCFAALAYAVVSRKLEIDTCVVGIIGAGKVGSLFASKLAALNISYLVCDPPLAMEQAIGEQVRYSSLDEVLACDVVSLHVPLTSTGEFPSRNLLGLDELRRLKQGALLIHSCRGGVIDEDGLRQFRRERSVVCRVFDVFKGEPEVDRRTSDLLDLVTPHIAGYSQEAKSAATELLRQAFQRHFKIKPVATSTFEDGPSTLVFDQSASAENCHWRLLLCAFPLEQLSLEFKAAIAGGQSKAAFEKIRQQLLRRREFKTMAIDAGSFTAEQRQFLSVLGFRFSP